jgi:predicted RNA-binding protein with RPS1 domain
VAVTTRRGWAAPDFDLESFVEEIGDAADVVLLPTGEATWELSSRLPERLDVYGGALRIWWPGVTADSNPYEHPLFLMYGEHDVRQKWREVLDELRRPRPVASPIGRRPRPGEVVKGVVTDIVPYGAFVEVDGHRGLIHVSELSERYVDDPADELEGGEEVRARVLETGDGRLAFSFREEHPDASAEVVLLRAEVRRLKEEVRELAEERRTLLLERQRLQETLRHRPHRSPQRQREETTITGEEDFRHLVSQRYEERYAVSDREEWPLRPYSLNEAFLQSMRALEGISPDRIVDVCVHVITGRAHRFDGLAVHPEREAADLGLAPLLLGLGFGQAHRGDLRRRVGAARNG